MTTHRKGAKVAESKDIFLAVERTAREKLCNPLGDLNAYESSCELRGKQKT